MLSKRCQENEIKISDFWRDNSSLDPEHKNILFEIAQEVEWRGRESKLLKRIRKQARNKKFSVRDIKHLSKLVNQQRRKGYRNFDELVYYFPGKDSQTLEMTYYQNFKK